MQGKQLRIGTTVCLWMTNAAASETTPRKRAPRLGAVPLISELQPASSPSRVCPDVPQCARLCRTEVRRDASNQCPTSQPRFQPFIFHPRVPLLVAAPKPYGRRHPDRLTFVGRRHKHAPSRKPLARRTTCRSRPLASRASVWTTLLSGRIQVSLRTFFCVSFCLRSSALHSTISSCTLAFLPSSIAAPP